MCLTSQIGVLFCGWNHVRNLVNSVSVISFRKRIGCFVLLSILEWVYVPKEGGECLHHVRRQYAQILVIDVKKKKNPRIG